MDLAKTDTPSRAIPQTTFNRETTLPRVSTDRPDREVNQPIVGASGGGASAMALAKLLGVAGDAAATVAGDIQAKKDKADEAQAAFDFASGNENQDLYKNSRAYYQAWQLEGAKAKSLDIAQKATDAVNEVLNNPNATPEDADAAIEKVFFSETHDEKGNLLDFGTPESKLTLAHSLAEVKGKLMPAVHAAIKERQDQKLLGTTFDNLMVEHTRGAPIGDPNAVPAPDRLASIDAFLNSTTPDRAPTHLLGKLSDPFPGFTSVHLTGRLGDARAGHVHNGEDFPVPDGTPITAPMAGTVIASWDDTAHGGGQSVRVKLANGAIVGFAHLSERHAQVGDNVNAGQLLGLSGQSGDATGPHVHMTVVVNGKHVSPRDYFAKNAGGTPVVASGEEPQLQPVPATQPVVNRPGLDIETFLSRVPPSISKSDAKTYFIQEAIAKAYSTGDASLLNGLEDSKRPDGTPSFNPEEQLHIERAREEIRTSVEAKAERAKTKMQGDNLDRILNAYNNGNPPSNSWLAAQGAKGLIDPRQAYTLIDHNEAMAREAAAQARMEARAAKQDREEGITQNVNSLASAMMAGVPSAVATSDDELRQQFQRGDFGPVGSSSAMAHYRTLMTAKRQGQKLLEESPDYKRYGAMLDEYRPLTSVGANPLLIDQRGMGGTHLDKPTFTEMVAAYHDEVMGGKTPGDAYRDAVNKYVKHQNAAPSSGPPTNAVNRLSYLKCKQAGICK